MLLTEWLFYMLLSEYLTAFQRKLTKHVKNAGDLLVHCSFLPFITGSGYLHWVCLKFFLCSSMRTYGGKSGSGRYGRVQHWHCCSVIPLIKCHEGSLPLPVHPHGLFPGTIAITWSLLSVTVTGTWALFCAQVPVTPVPWGLHRGLGTDGGSDWAQLNESKSYLQASQPLTNVEPGQGPTWWQWHPPS